MLLALFIGLVMRIGKFGYRQPNLWADACRVWDGVRAEGT